MFQYTELSRPKQHILDQPRAYKITFQKYLSYQVFNESFVTSFPESSGEADEMIRKIEHADYLQRFNKNERAVSLWWDEHFGYLTAYIIPTWNHVIEILAPEEPVVEVLSHEDIHKYVSN
ncbi:hypothetical protein [Deinococcus sp.]|uniref:hypothetical protein n=1 Tax=Deinococcus sp. TaxID=47478 RepID=UPI003B5A247D